MLVPGLAQLFTNNERARLVEKVTHLSSILSSGEVSDSRARNFELLLMKIEVLCMEA
jgi:hypothetical protein